MGNNCIEITGYICMRQFSEPRLAFEERLHDARSSPIVQFHSLKIPGTFFEIGHSIIGFLCKNLFRFLVK